MLKCTALSLYRTILYLPGLLKYSAIHYYTWQVNQRNIIKKLYFDVDPEAKDEEDPSLLTNQVQELKLQLRKKDKELSTSKAEQQSEEDKQKVLKKSIKELEKMVKMEQTSNSSLKKQLQLARIQQEVVEQEKKECYDIKRKLVHLQNVEKLVTGTVKCKIF